MVIPDQIQNVLNSILNVLQILLTFSVAYLVVLWLTLCFWTFRDIQARSRDIFAQISATLLVLFFNIPGILIYRLIRPKETLAEAYERSLQEEYMLQDLEERDICPTCRVKVQPDFNYCYNCRTHIRRECPACGYSIKLKWANCPNCGTAVKSRGREREIVAPSGLGSGRAATAPVRPATDQNRAIVPTIDNDSGIYQPPTYPASSTNSNYAPPRPRPSRENDAADAGSNPTLSEQTEHYPDPTAYQNNAQSGQNLAKNANPANRRNGRNTGKLNGDEQPTEKSAES